MFPQRRVLALKRSGKNMVSTFKQWRKTHREQIYHPESCNPTILILRINTIRNSLWKCIPSDKSFTVHNWLLKDYYFLLVLYHDLHHNSGNWSSLDIRTIIWPKGGYKESAGVGAGYMEEDTAAGWLKHSYPECFRCCINAECFAPYNRLFINTDT